MKKVVVLGAGGFIGNHLVKRLKESNCYVVGVDLKRPDFSKSVADEFIIGDLRDQSFIGTLDLENVMELYQLAADMGGAGYVFSGEHDAEIMSNSTQINLNVLKACVKNNGIKVFFSSSACIYPVYNQMDPSNPKCDEDSAYPAQPDSEYGWEKLFSERLFLAYHSNAKLDVRIARFHNIYGPENAFEGGKEKAPAALCRKIIEASEKGSIEIWGDGNQTRSFLYIHDCLDAIELLMASDYVQPINIGSEEMISITNFAKMISNISNKQISFNHIDGPVGVAGRSSDNKLIEEVLNWKPKIDLQKGIEQTFNWIKTQID